jgi:spectinomycin phosphotransferase
VLDALAAGLRTHYGIEATAFEPAERGKDFDASVFRVWAGGAEPRYVVKTRPTDAPRDVAAAVARHVADAGVPGVVAPVPSLSGAVFAHVGDRALSVYPFVDGRHGIEMQLSDDAWRSFGSFARRLHATALPADLAAVIPRETYRPPQIERIALVEATVAESRSGDAIARDVGAFWRSHRAEIVPLAGRAESLGAALARRSLPLVTCHADMHTGNVIVDRHGRLWIIDWDEVVLAPKERDLMFVVGGGISTGLVDANATAQFLEGYGEVDVDRPALTYYRHAWAVQDVGGYAWRVLLDDSASVDQRAEAARILIGLFEPGEIVDLAGQAFDANDI